jgi:hypothetical protein
MSLPNRAEHYGTDVDIWWEHNVFADLRPGLSEAARRILWEHGFTLDHAWLGPDRRVLARDDGWADDKACATRAAEALIRAGFTANLDPVLLSRDALADQHSQLLRRRRAAILPSPAAGTRPSGAPDDAAPPSPTAPTTARRAR